MPFQPAWCFDGTDDIIIITTYAGTPKVPTVGGVPHEDQPPEPRSGSSDMILHEIGHAFDKVRGHPSKKEGFTVAYGTIPKDKLDKYYIQAKNSTNNPLEPSDDGRSEAFAESFAQFYSKQPPNSSNSALEELVPWWETYP
jgi:hypothetical protein